MSELEHTRVNIRVLKALDGVVLLAALEEPGDGEAELSVLGAKVCLCHVADQSEGDRLVGVLVVVERERSMRKRLNSVAV